MIRIRTNKKALKEGWSETFYVGTAREVKNIIAKLEKREIFSLFDNGPSLNMNRIYAVTIEYHDIVGRKFYTVNPHRLIYEMMNDGYIDCPSYI